MNKSKIYTLLLPLFLVAHTTLKASENKKYYISHISITPKSHTHSDNSDDSDNSLLDRCFLIEADSLISFCEKKEIEDVLDLEDKLEEEINKELVDLNDGNLDVMFCVMDIDSRNISI